MTSVQELRSVIIGPPGFTAAEEQTLLAASPAAGQGSPQCRAALPSVAAHKTEFKPRQVPRLQPSASVSDVVTTTDRRSDPDDLAIP
jgi:hypothetical protein